MTCDVCLEPLKTESERDLRCLRVKRTGDIVWKRRHDACHARYMTEKIGLEDVGDIERDRELERLARERAAGKTRVVPQVPIFGGTETGVDDGGVVVNTVPGGVSYEKRGGAKFTAPRTEMSRVERIFMSRRERLVGLGVSARAKILQEKSRERR